MANTIVTIDGPAGSGKSSVARHLARELGLSYLDTGAMYRAVAARALDSGLDPAMQPRRVTELTQRMTLEVDWNSDPPRLIVDGQLIADRLRDADVRVAVSDVAVLPEIRQVLVDAQRRLASQRGGLVTEGRDQGSVVFPDADVKFYLDADPTVRARRRALELQEIGEQVDEQEVYAELLRRDQRDHQRSDGPLVCPDDAVRIDTSEMTFQQVVSRLAEIVRQRMCNGPTQPVGSGA